MFPTVFLALAGPHCRPPAPSHPPVLLVIRSQPPRRSCWLSVPGRPARSRWLSVPGRPAGPAGYPFPAAPPVLLVAQLHALAALRVKLTVGAPAVGLVAPAWPHANTRANFCHSRTVRTRTGRSGRRTWIGSHENIPGTQEHQGSRLSARASARV